MFITRFLAAASGLVLLLASTATCAAPDLPVVPAASAGIASKLIVRGDLQGLQVVDLRAQRRNDMLVVRAEIANTQTGDLRLYYRFRWSDPDGMPVGEIEVWKPLVFLGLQTQLLKGTAYGPQATDFQLEMSAEPR